MSSNRSLLSCCLLLPLLLSSLGCVGELDTSAELEDDLRTQRVLRVSACDRVKDTP